MALPRQESLHRVCAICLRWTVGMYVIPDMVLSSGQVLCSLRHAALLDFDYLAFLLLFALASISLSQSVDLLSWPAKGR